MLDVKGLTALGLCALAACGDDGSSVRPDAAGAADASPDTVSTRTITGHGEARFISSTAPYDFTTFDLEAISLPSFSHHPGTGMSDGTFAIPGVPVGDYYLAVDSDHFQLSADTVDLSFDAVGRASVTPAPPGTSVALSATGMTPWTLTDDLQLAAATNNLYIAAADDAGGAGAPTIGVTSLSGFAVSLTGEYLLDAALDKLYITQLAAQSDGQNAYNALARSWEPAAFSTTSGATTTLSGGTFTTPPALNLGFSWDRAAFIAALDAVIPNSTYQYPQLYVHAQPDAATRGWQSGMSGDLVSFEPGYVMATTPLDLSVWSVRNPYPSSWTPLVTAYMRTYRFVPAPAVPGVTEQMPLFATLSVTRDISTVGTSLAPLIGPVTDLKINGSPALDTMTGVTLTPTISWQAPTLGTPHHYAVRVFNLVNNAGNARPNFVTSFATTSTSVTVPPAVLRNGQVYLFGVEAVARTTTVSFHAEPLRGGLPEGFSYIQTGPASP